jgi:DNA-directed RNA polymerase subunit RPC12/RpoP
MEKFKCCLCGKEVEGYGNDPHPIQTQNEDDECCDECNLAIVVPARMEIYLKSKTETNVN